MSSLDIGDGSLVGVHIRLDQALRRYCSGCTACESAAEFAYGHWQTQQNGMGVLVERVLAGGLLHIRVAPTANLTMKLVFGGCVSAGRFAIYLQL